MRVTVGALLGGGIVAGGVDVEIPATVYTDPLAKEPVFHRPARFAGDGQRFSACRKIVVSSQAGNHLAQVVPVRFVHAARFARPCLYCWPELKSKA